MSQKRYLCVKNFDTHLHYKDNNPIWIKLYCSILDDYEFAKIADETKFHAVGLMLLASRLNNKFPDDERWLRQKINANSKINLKLLLEIGFLEPIKGSRSIAKVSFNGCKPNKTQAKLSRAVLENSQNQSRTEQNRTEQNKTEHNTTEHGNADAVLCSVDSENSKSKIQDSEIEIQKSKITGFGIDHKRTYFCPTRRRLEKSRT